MEKEFLNRVFEFGGTLGNLQAEKGNYNGVYIFVRPDDFGKVIFGESKLKFWRGYEVSLTTEELQNKWVENANVLYIGKCSSKTKSLQKLVRKHIEFWNGKEVSAYGGKAIGQIQNWKDLQVWYLECADPQQAKTDLLKDFFEKYGKLPFANL